MRLFARCAPVLVLAVLAAALSPAPSLAAEFKLEKADDGVTVTLDGKPFTRYLIAAGPKPYLWPITGPTGKPMTRAFPMEKVEGEKQDHPHHRSLWFTHGNVNGIDFWAEKFPPKDGAKAEAKEAPKGEAPKTSGTTKHREFLKVESGPVAVIQTANDWISPEGKKQLEDVRTVTFRTAGESRIIDFDIVLKASDGPVTFGDTKEGAFGVRVPTEMDVTSKKGGEIVNSEGQKNDAAWGQTARWVDYHGPVEGETLGIAILNHPSSFRFPTPWHVRTYGLFAANPFGLKDFAAAAKKETTNGTYQLEPGKTLSLRYRVIFHKGDHEAGKIADAWDEYSKAP